MKVADLEGAMLDYWVGRAAELPISMLGGMCIWQQNMKSFTPSTSWAIGGQIIERARIGMFEGAIWPTPENPPEKWIWYACVGGSPNYGVSLESYGHPQMSGPTPLIAAMRAFVQAKFGGDVPDSAD